MPETGARQTGNNPEASYPEPSNHNAPHLPADIMAWLLSLVPEAAAIAIFAMTYLVVAIGRLPGFRLDRAGAALVGASLMVAVGALPLEEAPKAIDFDTIILLLGVMIVVANLRLSG